MDLINLNSFLSIGYFLKCRKKPYTVDFSCIDKQRYENATEKELIEIGSQVLRDSVNSHFSVNEKHVVPLSGGLDSRAILSILLEFTDASNIQTYTFGIPKTFNYELGSKVALKAGVKHTKFNLNDLKYTQEYLLELSKRFLFQTMLFYHQPFGEIEKRFGNHTIWSGFLLDMISGCHLPQHPSETLEQAQEKFIKKNQFVKSYSLTNVEAKEFYKFIEWQGVSQKKLSLDEQLDIDNRQLKYNAPHLLCSGFNYQIPGLDSTLFKFMLSLPSKYRADQILYRKILLKNYPKLFKIGNTRTLGLPLKNTKYQYVMRVAYIGIRKRLFHIVDNINYIDFDRGLRERNDLKKIVYENLNDLKERKIIDWIDIDYLWKNHMNKTGNFADALLILASLEIHLKAGKKI